jgi:hypothetical protein
MVASLPVSGHLGPAQSIVSLQLQRIGKTFCGKYAYCYLKCGTTLVDVMPGYLKRMSIGFGGK